MGGGDPVPVTAKLRNSRRSRRTPRASHACETCRVRKTKCDQGQPCSYCVYHSLDCVYRDTRSGGSSATPLKRSTQLREIQTGKGRPSPWPEVNQRAQRDLPQSKPSSLLVEKSSSEPHDANVKAISPATFSNKQDKSSIIAASPDLGDSASREGLSGVNIHTNGTEFYGTSSNIAFLENLYARAHKHLETRGSNVVGSGAPVSPNTPSNLISDSSHCDKNFATQNTPSSTRDMHQESTQPNINKTPLSIVNLLYNPNYPSHSPPQLGGTVNSEKQTGNVPNSFQNDPENGLPPVINNLSDEAQIEIEKIFINSYFSNENYIHPMLCKSSFMQRCENEVFLPSKHHKFYRGLSKFSGLYFAVVATGAINASPNETALLDHYCNYSLGPGTTTTINKPSSLDFADLYFGIAKQALADIFESSSLESAQALLVLSVFCQNALRPHSCYMYSGMAVRTAVAIGLASGISSLSPAIRKEAIRTWWSIYSHEVEICCSSGRLDSVKELSYYQVPLPNISTSLEDPHNSDLEGKDVAMIPVMVALARIMSEASHLLYHSPKRDTRAMSQVAMNLDNKLLMWKSTLPEFLNIDAASLNDPEWAFKQKLVLRLRFYNTRILIHRQFLAVSGPTTDVSTLMQHVHICLGAAKSSIQMQYEAFLHRIYFRTWWYNTTYALYAAMILLHLVLAGFPDIPDDELLADVDKSLDIFESMNDIVVARRCAEMIKEVLGLARACSMRRRAHLTSAGPLLVSNSSVAFDIQSNMNIRDNQLDTTGAAASAIDGNFFLSLFNQESQLDTRANILANLIDPTFLEDFAFGNDSPFLLDS